MPQRANVTSVEAIRAFRTNLIVYLTKARPTLEEVSGDVLRTRLWLQNEQRSLWEGEMKRSGRRLEEAKANLFSAKMSNLREASTAEQAAVYKAKRAMDEAEAKLRVIKQWDRNFENQTEPLVKQMEKLHSVLASDLPNAVAQLTQMLNALEQYASVARPSGPAKAPGSGGDAGASSAPAGMAEPGQSDAGETKP